MRRIALVLLLAGFACSEGEQSQPEAAPVVGETVTLPSGVKITHRVIGTGATPTATDRVTVHYHGTFPDGKVFDSSVDRGQPATFPLNRVIDCWTEGVQLIKVGGKAQLICPPQTAYGPRGQPPLIPPDATLHFEVELIAIP
jgi:FKBP-type peptidyl-prolyl cis-trans isomerase FkpA